MTEKEYSVKGSVNSEARKFYDDVANIVLNLQHQMCKVDWKCDENSYNINVATANMKIDSAIKLLSEAIAFVQSYPYEASQEKE